MVAICSAAEVPRAKDTKGRILATALEVFTHVYSAMMDKGLLHRDDSAMLALTCTAPISALIHLCGREPGKLSRKRSGKNDLEDEYELQDH